MRAFIHRHQIHFDDTMAYGSHHFLTNFRFQCGAREALLFRADSDGTDPWTKGLQGVELLTQQGYARNLAPVGLGDRVAVLMTCDELGFGSFRLCFRVVSTDARPVTCGYQVIVVIDKSTRQVTAVPEFIRRRLEEISEPAGWDFAALTLRGGKALKGVFPNGLCERAAAIGAGREPLPELPFAAFEDGEADRGRLALVCPGQGSYDRAFLAEVGRLDRFGRLVAEAESRVATRLGAGFRLFTDSRERAGRFYREQLGIYLGAVAAGQLLRERYGEPALVVGHSVGEVAALVLADVLTPESGLRVILERTRALLEHGPADGSLLAVEAPRADLVPKLADGAAGFLAVVNHMRQSVVAGTAEQLAVLEGRLAGVRSRRVAAEFPFHSPLLWPAVGPLATALADLRWGPPRVPVRSPMERGDWRPEWHLPTVLASHLVRPLDFAACVAELAGDGRWRFAECSRRGVVGRLIEQGLGANSSCRVLPSDIELSAATPALEPAPPCAFEPLAIVACGVCLPGAANVEAYAELLEDGTIAVRDRREVDPTAEDFLGTPEGEPDRTYTLLAGLVDPLPPVPERFAGLAASREPCRVWRLAAAALDECVGGLRSPPTGACHVVVGSTADGCDAFDDAIAADRLHATGVIDEAARRRFGTVRDLDHHAGFAELARAALGPDTSVTVVDAACASSLFAVDLAARLLPGCDVVIAGGAFAPGLSNNCLFAQFRGLSPTGSRPLDPSADGVVFGEGAAFVALKRLDRAAADGDRILGVLRGTGLSCDGRGASVSKPSAEGQELALRRAYTAAGIDPARVQYVEAHATGTSVGDATELTALTRFFKSASEVTLGSVKSQLGHTGWAAGAASLVKVLIALNRERLPAQHGSGGLPLAGTPFVVPTEPRLWPAPAAGPQVAGVNAFGFGGTNCHAVVEEWVPGSHLPAFSTTPHTTVICVTESAEYSPTELDPLRKHGPGGAGWALLPDVVDTMDPSQMIAVDLAGRLLRGLPAGWERHAERVGVVAFMPGKTAAIVRANDRVLARRMARLAHVDPIDVLRRLGATEPTGPYTLTGGMPNIAPARVSQVFGLNGPNILVAAATDGGPTAARRYAASLVADGTCAAVVVLVIEPDGGWVPERYRARAELVADAATARVDRWLTVQPAESDGAFDTTAAIGFYAPELVPLADTAGVADGGRLLVLADEPLRRRLAATIPREWELAAPDADPRPGHDGIILVNDFATHELLGDGEPWRRVLAPLIRVARSHYEALGAGQLALACFGLRAFADGRPRPATGLVGGFVKSLGRELPQARVVAVHCDDEDVTAAARAAAQAWAHRGSPCELFRRCGQVLTHALRPLPIPEERTGTPPLAAGDLVVATGGARGITAELVAGLLARYACRVVLLGRSDPGEVPAEWRGLDAAAVEAGEADYHRRSAAAEVGLRDSRRAFERLRAAHEVAANLRRFAALPGSAEYRRCDVTNDAAVRAALAPERVTPVRLVLHGAGVQSSGRLDRKDPTTFWRIIETKLGGLRAVLRALDGQRPHVHVATSAFSYFGNDGQQDYGAANEALNRLADAGGPGWSALAWLAWDGIGMTRGSEYRALARERRMRGVRGPEGASLLARLLAAGTPGTTVLMTDNERERYAVATLSAGRTGELRLDWRSPSLRQHRVNGRAICPACLSVTAMVRAAAAHAVKRPCAVEDCRFERPLGERVGPARVLTRPLPGGAAVEAWVEADRRTPDGTLVQAGVRFASCRVRFGDPGPLEAVDAEPFEAAAVTDPYRHSDSPVNLGPVYDCLRGLLVSPRANAAAFTSPIDVDPALRDGVPPPLIVDALLRLGVLHEAGGELPVYVPVSIDRIAWADDSIWEPVPLKLACEGPTADGDAVRCARAAARDSAGRVVLSVTGYAGRRLGAVPLAGPAARVTTASETDP
jgi:3-oxoacyl-(acyl-carrier-protein) synthase/acyl-CoA thioesterase FadM/NAD(P)-dependent dehydrogenase (short-subunit alcohol dehydrogenase family)